MALQLICGMMYTNLDDYLLFGKLIIVMLLREVDGEGVQVPSSKKLRNTNNWFRIGTDS
jgi:hypothetical protein